MNNMKNRELSWVASRYAFGEKGNSFISLISWISMVGIMLAVALLIVVLSVVNGFEKELESKLLVMSGHANIEDPSGRLSNRGQLTSIAKKNNNVLSVSPYIQSIGMLVYENRLSSITFRGINSINVNNENPEFSDFIKQGDIIELKNNSFKAIIGQDLANYLKVEIGDIVNLNLTEGISTPMGIFPRSKDFEVSGIFRAGMSEYDRNLVLIDISDAQRLMRMGDSVTGLRLSVKNIYEANQTVREVALSMGGNFLIGDWTQSHSNLFFSIRITKSILFIILLSVIAVASFNIVSTLMMVVREKESDIAILRTNGISSSSILKIYIYHGFIVGSLGTILGVTVGSLLALNFESIIAIIESLFDLKILASEVYFISDVPADLRIIDVATVATIAFIMTLLSTIYPAWTALRVSPSEILRYEK
jgi:lipoprotein-releasing system permease protein